MHACNQRDPAIAMPIATAAPTTIAMIAMVAEFVVLSVAVPSVLLVGTVGTVVPEDMLRVDDPAATVEVVDEFKWKRTVVILQGAV